MQNNNFMTLSQLCIEDGDLKCIPKGKRATRKVHFRQGDLDGACGVYSIAICLSILGTFDPDNMLRDDLSSLDADEKSLIEALNGFGLYREGLSAREIVTILNKNFGSRVKATSSKSGSQEDLVKKIINTIEKDIPTIMLIEPPRAAYGHWVVCVGYQYNEENVVSRLLCLDPGFEPPRLTLWNGMLDWDSRKKVHSYHNPESSKGNKLIEIISIMPAPAE